MKYEDLKRGDIFNVENTPTYPKMKLSSGYVDMRDKILNETGNTVKGRKVEKMSISDLSKTFEKSEGDIEEWITEISNKYN